VNTVASNLPLGVARAIRCAAFRASRRLRRYGFDFQDIEQEFFLHWVGRRHCHDAGRASALTFATHICRRRALQMIEGATTEKRGGSGGTMSLANPVAVGREGRTTELERTISQDEYEANVGRRSRSFAELLILCIDVNRAINRLPAKLAHVANLLASGMPAVEAAQHLQISRATLYRRIGQLRHVFREAGLHGYVVLKEAA
jgi:DNA-directed RNA polymerase specialized sigma24 family protein